MRSSAVLPRRRVGACSPSTHRMASTTLDLPHPLGPTTAVTPGAKLMLVCSKKDLKPTSSRLLRRIYPRLRHNHHATFTKLPAKRRERQGMATRDGVRKHLPALGIVDRRLAPTIHSIKRYIPPELSWRL